ncbi:MAG TPA: class I SAM-dependent methyltransferase [Tepidisphaeraceae bacterium]|nr:class I SAM-dependent methyltransferase [Tepidisphaeraceae bacterium]
MNLSRLGYQLMYLLGRRPWERGATPPEVEAALQDADIPPGPFLDLGCGTGRNVIAAARSGREAIGIDFVPKAVKTARSKAEQAGLTSSVRLHVGDVTHLEQFNLPVIAFALDMGCFHGIDAAGRERYLAGLSERLMPGGRFMLYSVDPHSEGPVRFGITAEEVAAEGARYLNIIRQQRGEFWGPTSTWTWMAKAGG